MSPTDDWNHMELVESNSSSDNVARSSPLPPPPPPQPEVPLCLMSLPFRKDCNWRRSIGGWGQEQSDRHFQKSTCGIRGGNGFAAKHSITRNYNNSTLEDGLFHFIMRFPLSCLLMGAGGGGASWTATGTMWNRYFVPHLNAFIFFPFMSCRGLSPRAMIFSPKIW